MTENHLVPPITKSGGKEMDKQMPKIRNKDTINNNLYKKHRIYEEAVVHQGYISTWHEDKDTKKIKYTKRASYVGIKEIIEDIDTGTVDIILSYKLGEEPKEVSAKAGDIASKTKLANLADRGVDINDINAKYVLMHLRNERDDAPKKLVHSKLGFSQKMDI